jgi:hypothetical protein
MIDNYVYYFTKDHDIYYPVILPTNIRRLYNSVILMSYITHLHYSLTKRYCVTHTKPADRQPIVQLLRRLPPPRRDLYQHDNQYRNPVY